MILRGKQGMRSAEQKKEPTEQNIDPLIKWMLWSIFAFFALPTVFNLVRVFFFPNPNWFPSTQVF